MKPPRHRVPATLAHRRARKLTSIRLHRSGTKLDVTRFPVAIRQSWLDRDLHDETVVVDVIAHTPAAAAQLVWDEVAPRVSRPTEILVIGPKGGLCAYRFVGWDSMVMANFIAEKPTSTQLALL